MTHDLHLYMQWMIERGLAARTIEQRFEFARRIFAAWQHWEGDQHAVRAFLAPFSGHSRRTYYDHFVALFHWLTATGRVEVSPMLDVERPRKPRPRPRPLSVEAAAASLASAEGDLRAFLLLGRYAGLRAHEIAKFRGEHVDSSSVEVLGKGGQWAVLPTHPVLWDLAQLYPRKGFWFPSNRTTAGHMTGHSVTMRISRHFQRLGIDGSSHRNRHLYGTNLLRQGANLRVVQELMRHADLTTTLLYLGVDELEKIEAINRLVA